LKIKEETIVRTLQKAHATSEFIAVTYYALSHLALSLVIDGQSGWQEF